MALTDSVTVAQQFLVLFVKVRILVGQPSILRIICNADNPFLFIIESHLGKLMKSPILHS